MKSNNTKNIGQVIQKLMSNPKLFIKLKELDALDICRDFLGDNLQNFILDMKIYEGILHIVLSSSVLRDEIGYKKSELKEKINKKIGFDIIKDIRLQ